MPKLFPLWRPGEFVTDMAGPEKGDYEKTMLQPVELKHRYRKRVSYLHRTATPTYPCSIPRLGDSVGAGRIRLTRGQK